MENILTSVKKLIGISAECTDFDMDVILHVNSTFSVLTQLGVGPSEGFSISDDTTIWSDFIPAEDRNKFSMVKTYVFMKAKLVFDPPTNSATLQALKESIEEYEWRLNVAAESNGGGSQNG